jgi:predicted nucleotidyltransferase component of viral defense system
VIDLAEIEAKAVEFDLHTSDVQRDYVYGWIAASVARDDVLGRDLVLKGGNAFRKAYFPATRFSDDLDYSVGHGYDDEDLLRRLNSICSEIEQQAGVVFDVERNKTERRRFLDGDRELHKLRLYFRDFSGDPRELTLKVRVDVTEFDRLVLPVQSRRLIHPYSDREACAANIPCVKLEEALADKLRALLQRQHAHDLFDLVHGIFVAESLDVDRVEIVRTFLAKSTFGSSASTARGLFVALPFELMRRFWERIVIPAQTRITFDDALGRFTSGLAELFAPFAVPERRPTGFFPAEQRAAILTAASRSTLLRLVYDGVPRLVEPYALVFKRPQGRPAREYFYVYDRSGGRSSGPGVKSMFPEKIQHVEVTDETFQPRYPVELVGGSNTASDTFARPFGAGGRRSPTRRPSRPRPYRVQCPYCNKVFPREHPTTKLNAHKNEFGTSCAGRSGYLV